MVQSEIEILGKYLTILRLQLMQHPLEIALMLKLLYWDQYHQSLELKETAHIFPWHEKNLFLNFKNWITKLFYTKHAILHVVVIILFFGGELKDFRVRSRAILTSSAWKRRIFYKRQWLKSGHVNFSNRNQHVGKLREREFILKDNRRIEVIYMVMLKFIKHILKSWRSITSVW